MPRRNKTTFMLKLAFVLLVILAASAFPLGSVAAVSPADSLTTEAKTHRPGILVSSGHYWSEPVSPWSICDAPVKKTFRPTWLA